MFQYGSIRVSSKTTTIYYGITDKLETGLGITNQLWMFGSLKRINIVTR